MRDKKDVCFGNLKANFSVLNESTGYFRLSMRTVEENAPSTFYAVIDFNGEPELKEFAWNFFKLPKINLEDSKYKGSEVAIFRSQHLNIEIVKDSDNPFKGLGFRFDSCSFHVYSNSVKEAYDFFAEMVDEMMNAIAEVKTYAW